MDDCSLQLVKIPVQVDYIDEKIMERPYSELLASMI